METPLDIFVLKEKKVILDTTKKIIDVKLYHLRCKTGKKEKKK